MIYEKLFLDCFEYTKKNEGGYNKIPSDRGGATNYGISLRFLKDCYNQGMAFCDMNNDGKIDEKDIILLDEETSQNLYHKVFFTPMKIRHLKRSRVGIKLYDTGVNVGAKRAVEFLQKSINALQINDKILVDGKIGKITIGEANKHNEDNLLNSYVTFQSQFYQNLAYNDDSQQKFLKGWLNRACRLP